MLTCCPLVVRPPFTWQRGSLPYLLSFALQLALDVQVPVGSLLPYGSQRWGHPCGVEAGEVLDRNEGLVCFSFHFGLILRDEVTLWVETLFDLILDRNGEFSESLWVETFRSHSHRNEEFSESLFGWFRAFTVASRCELLHSIATETSFLFHRPISFGMRSPCGSSVVVGSHLITNKGFHWWLDLDPPRWASSLCLRLLFVPCR